jgi:NAD(P)H-dependent FMN reductase
MKTDPAATKQLLIVANTPSVNTRALAAAALRGAQHPDIENVDAKFLTPFEAGARDVRDADGMLLGTTENFGYMSGALKDFFERIYYEVLEEKQGMPYALYVRAGLDGTGTLSAVQRIVTGLRWKRLQEPLLCHGDYDERFVSQVEELGMLMAASLDAGIA